MYTLTLEINQRCNLKCRYCYLGEKSGSKMSLETAHRAIDIAFNKTAIHRDRKLWIDFVGGESFLDMDMIRDLVDYILKKNEQHQYKLLFSVTTNATIFNQEIVDFLVEKNFGLKVSIDGDKTVNDLNRVASAGYSVHDKVLSNLEYLKQFEKRTGRYVQVTNVITGNNFDKYFDTLVYLTSELGFKIIDTAIDVGFNWTDQQMDVLEKNIRQSFDYFIEAAASGKGFRWEFADKVVDMKKDRKRFYTCGAGIISMYVRTGGEVYACPGNLNPSVELGNVHKGFNKAKIDNLKHLEEIENEICQKCEISPYCVERSCIMQNLAVTGDVNKPIPIFCRLRKLMYQIYIDQNDVIKRLVM